MTELLTAAQMRAAEAAAMDSGSVTGLELMERAGRGVVEAIWAEWPELAAAPHAAAVLCGPGNNGGDGFVVARLLREWGWQVRLFLFGDAERLPPDARTNHDRWVAMGGAVEGMAPDVLAGLAPELWVDAIFGTGLSREVPDQVYRALDAAEAAARESGGRIVAIDMPSWFSSDSGAHLGRRHGAAFDLVAAVAPLKIGQFTGAAPHHIRALRAVDIGLSLPAGMRGVELMTRDSAAVCAKPMGHKYSHGHALVLSGGPGRTGAARLAARAALRVGAGLVTLGCPPAAQLECAAQLTAVMLARVADAAALEARLADKRLNAVCLGPGLGLTQREADLVAATLRARRSAVLDADALRLVAEREDLRKLLHAACILTPHAGEFASLFPDLAASLADGGSKVEAARAAAARSGAVVLFKGPDTVIAAPDGRAALNACLYADAAPWLATAGAGDVLAGMIAGLLARGCDGFVAAATAAWLHAECARDYGPGLIAEDLPEALPGVLRKSGV